MTITKEEAKEQLMNKIEGTAEQNLDAKEALMELRDYIEKLPSDHDLFRVMQKAIVAAEGNTFESIVREEEELIKRYGFQDPAEPEPFVIKLATKLVENMDTKSMTTEEKNNWLHYTVHLQNKLTYARRKNM